jgi:hypothetical protein
MLGSHLQIRRYAGALIVMLSLDGMTASAQDVPLPSGYVKALANGTRDASGRPGERRWRMRPAYEIAAELDVPTATVRGRGRVVMRNVSPTSLTAIQLRLEQNRFRRGSARNVDSASMTEGITITRLQVNGQAVAIGAGTGEVLPRLSGERTTSARVHLRDSILPGQTVTLRMEWHFVVPRDDEGRALRQGRRGNELFQVAQWYPRIAMYDDLEGWDVSVHDGNTEFYNPFASFDVRLDVPAGWVVGATGLLQNATEVLSPGMAARLRDSLRTDSVTVISSFAETSAAAASNGARRTWHFKADSVSDFAWGTSRLYEWAAMPVHIPGRGVIATHLLYTEALKPQFMKATAVLRHDLRFNSGLITPYAFPQHTLLDGPEGGMEYPMLTMSDAGDRLSHELWHQWFPMMVGTDEGRYSFMDEGFASYLTGVTEAARMNITTSRPPEPDRQRPSPLLDAKDPASPDPIAAALGYGRVSPMFRALEARVGRDRVHRALAEYARTWSFAHPSPWDFMAFMNRALGEDLDAFWYRWLYTTDPG